jgi:hypothetical protein
LIYVTFRASRVIVVAPNNHEPSTQGAIDD